MLHTSLVLDKIPRNLKVTYRIGENRRRVKIVDFQRMREEKYVLYDSASKPEPEEQRD